MKPASEAHANNLRDFSAGDMDSLLSGYAADVGLFRPDGQVGVSAFRAILEKLSRELVNPRVPVASKRGQVKERTV
jgi:hypothetical protein